MAPIHDQVASNIPVANQKESNFLKVKQAAQEARKAEARKSSYSNYSSSSNIAKTEDQYSNGVAASVWEAYIGENRENRYRNWLIHTLRKHGAKRVLDVACGTGVDSRMLVDAGFSMTSCDLSDKMLAVAKETKQRKNIKDWDIRQADWVFLTETLEKDGVLPGFDAVICMGNSFAHLPNEMTIDGVTYKNCHERAISNFRKMLRPGGILIIDHRNFDYIVKHQKSPSKNVYYQSSWPTDVDTTFDRNGDGAVTKIKLHYTMTVPLEVQRKTKMDLDESHNKITFDLTYFPHYLSTFEQLLRRVFNYEQDDETAPLQVCGDFQAEVVDPAYFIHVVTKERTAETCER